MIKFGGYFSLFFLWFGSTLSSYYFYKYSFSLDHVFVGFSFLLLMLSCKRILVSSRFILMFLLMLMLVFYGIVVASFLHDNVVLKTALAPIFYYVIISFMVYNAFDYKRLVLIIGFIIHTHAFLLIFQSLCMYVFGEIFDFTYFVTGEAQRVVGGYLFGSTWYRASGLFVEPGTYAAYLSCLLALYICIGGEKKTVFYLGALSVVLTFSIKGYLLISLVNFLIILRSDKVTIQNFAFFILFVVIFVLLVFYRLYYLEADSSAMIRYESLSKVTNVEEGWFSLLFGYGFSTGPLYGTGNSLLMYLWSYIGILSMLVVFFMFKAANKDLSKIVTIFVLFLTKIVPTSPFFWLVFLVVVLNPEHKERVSKKIFES